MAKDNTSEILDSDVSTSLSYDSAAEEHHEVKSSGMSENTEESEVTETEDTSKEGKNVSDNSSKKSSGKTPKNSTGSVEFFQNLKSNFSAIGSSVKKVLAATGISPTAATAIALSVSILVSYLAYTDTRSKYMGTTGEGLDMIADEYNDQMFGVKELSWDEQVGYAKKTYHYLASMEAEEYTEWHIFNYLTSQGFSDIAACAILGNGRAEQGNDPNFYRHMEWDDTVGMDCCGFITWTPDTTLTDWCEKNDLDWSELRSQLRCLCESTLPSIEGTVGWGWQYGKTTASPFFKCEDYKNGNFNTERFKSICPDDYSNSNDDENILQALFDATDIFLCNVENPSEKVQEENVVKRYVYAAMYYNQLVLNRDEAAWKLTIAGSSIQPQCSVGGPSEFYQSKYWNTEWHRDPYQGFTDEAIAGILANAMCESEMNSTRYEGDDINHDYNLLVNHHTNWNRYAQALFDVYAGNGVYAYLDDNNIIVDKEDMPTVSGGNTTYRDRSSGTVSLDNSLYRNKAKMITSGAIPKSNYKIEDAYAAAPDGEYLPGFGVFMWSGQRAQDLLMFANNLNNPVDEDGDGVNDLATELPTQLAYMYYENYNDVVNWAQKSFFRRKNVLIKRFDTADDDPEKWTIACCTRSVLDNSTLDSTDSDAKKRKMVYQYYQIDVNESAESTLIDDDTTATIHIQNSINGDYTASDDDCNFDDHYDHEMTYPGTSDRLLHLTNSSSSDTVSAGHSHDNVATQFEVECCPIMYTLTFDAPSDYNKPKKKKIHTSDTDAAIWIEPDLPNFDIIGSDDDSEWDEYYDDDSLEWPKDTDTNVISASEDYYLDPSYYEYIDTDGSTKTILDSGTRSSIRQSINNSTDPNVGVPPNLTRNKGTENVGNVTANDDADQTKLWSVQQTMGATNFIKSTHNGNKVSLNRFEKYVRGGVIVDKCLKNAVRDWNKNHPSDTISEDEYTVENIFKYLYNFVDLKTTNPKDIDFVFDTYDYQINYNDYMAILEGRNLDSNTDTNTDTDSGTDPLKDVNGYSKHKFGVVAEWDWKCTDIDTENVDKPHILVENVAVPNSTNKKGDVSDTDVNVDDNKLVEARAQYEDAIKGNQQLKLVVGRYEYAIKIKDAYKELCGEIASEYDSDTINKVIIQDKQSNLQNALINGVDGTAYEVAYKYDSSHNNKNVSTDSDSHVTIGDHGMKAINPFYDYNQVSNVNSFFDTSNGNTSNANWSIGNAYHDLNAEDELIIWKPYIGTSNGDMTFSGTNINHEVTYRSYADLFDDSQLQHNITIYQNYGLGIKRTDCWRGSFDGEGNWIGYNRAGEALQGWRVNSMPLNYWRWGWNINDIPVGTGPFDSNSFEQTPVNIHGSYKLIWTDKYPTATDGLFFGSHPHFEDNGNVQYVLYSVFATDGTHSDVDYSNKDICANKSIGWIGTLNWSYDYTVFDEAYWYSARPDIYLKTEKSDYKDFQFARGVIDMYDYVNNHSDKHTTGSVNNANAYAFWNYVLEQGVMYIDSNGYYGYNHEYNIYGNPQENCNGSGDLNPEHYKYNGDDLVKYTDAYVRNCYNYYKTISDKYEAYVNNTWNPDSDTAGEWFEGNMITTDTDKSWKASNNKFVRWKENNSTDDEYENDHNIRIKLYDSDSDVYVYRTTDTDSEAFMQDQKYTKAKNRGYDTYWYKVNDSSKDIRSSDLDSITYSDHTYGSVDFGSGANPDGTVNSIKIYGRKNRSAVAEPLEEYIQYHHRYKVVFSNTSHAVQTNATKQAKLNSDTDKFYVDSDDPFNDSATASSYNTYLDFLEDIRFKLQDQFDDATSIHFGDYEDEGETVHRYIDTDGTEKYRIIHKGKTSSGSDTDVTTDIDSEKDYIADEYNNDSRDLNVDPAVDPYVRYQNGEDDAYECAVWFYTNYLDRPSVTRDSNGKIINDPNLAEDAKSDPNYKYDAGNIKETEFRRHTDSARFWYYLIKTENWRRDIVKSYEVDNGVPNHIYAERYRKVVKDRIPDITIDELRATSYSQMIVNVANRTRTSPDEWFNHSSIEETAVSLAFPAGTENYAVGLSYVGQDTLRTPYDLERLDIAINGSDSEFAKYPVAASTEAYIAAHNLVIDPSSSDKSVVCYTYEETDVDKDGYIITDTDTDSDKIKVYKKTTKAALDNEVAKVSYNPSDLSKFYQNDDAAFVKLDEQDMVDPYYTAPWESTATIIRASGRDDNFPVLFADQLQYLMGYEASRLFTSVNNAGNFDDALERAYTRNEYGYTLAPGADKWMYVGRFYSDNLFGSIDAGAGGSDIGLVDFYDLKPGDLIVTKNFSFIYVGTKAAYNQFNKYDGFDLQSAQFAVVFSAPGATGYGPQCFTGSPGVLSSKEPGVAGVNVTDLEHNALLYLTKDWGNVGSSSTSSGEMVCVFRSINYDYEVSECYEKIENTGMTFFQNGYAYDEGITYVNVYDKSYPNATIFKVGLADYNKELYVQPHTSRWKKDSDSDVSKSSDSDTSSSPP